MTQDQNSRKVWKQDGVCFHPSTTAKDVKNLSGGVYRFVPTPLGWYLEMNSHVFTFPYKIYGQHDTIVERLQRAWPALNGNLGVLFDGVKGTGKTITAQILANWCIRELQMPVLVVDAPIPLKEVLDQLEQDVMIIFDEFEKTHQKKEDQQRILTCVDGMGRSQHRRFFLFTTNTPALEDNLIDRPSRIRYCWKFERLSDTIIEMLMDDLLDAENQKYRSDILQFLLTRNVCSIDVAKMVIQEVNLFKESPLDFESIVNLTKRTPTSFRITVLENGEETTYSDYFKPARHLDSLAVLLTQAGTEQYVEGNSPLCGSRIADKFSTKVLELVGPAEENDPTIWSAYLTVPIGNTWAGDYTRTQKRVSSSFFFADEQPEDWKVPSFAIKDEQQEEWTDEDYDEFGRWIDGHTVHGGPKKLFRIKLEAQYNSFNWKHPHPDSF